MKKATITIMGRKWEYKLLTVIEFLKEHPDCHDSAALTLPGYKQILFNVEYFDIGLVRHEVRHAFIAELCLNSADLDVKQFEEIQCTLDQERWDELNEVSTEIYENLILS